MVQPTYPGVYVEEVSSGVRPITAASTSTAAFIGQAQKGIINEAVKVYNFTQFQDQYGNFLPNSYLAHAVYQFFNNSGSQCYIIRVAGTGVQTANIGINDRGQEEAPPVAALPTLTIEASSPGEWGNNLRLVIADGTNDPDNEFRLDVYVEGEAIPRESYDNLGMVPDRSNFVETVTSTSSYISVARDDGNANADAKNGSSVSDGAIGIPSDAAQTRLRINVNGDGYQEINLQEAVAAGITDLSTEENIRHAIQAVVTGEGTLSGLKKQLPTTPDNSLFTGFTATLDGGNELTLTSGAAGITSSVNVAPASDINEDISGVLKLGRAFGGTEISASAVLRPTSGNYLVGDDTVVHPVASAVPGNDGSTTISDTEHRDAFPLLDSLDDVSLIAVPGRGSPYMVTEGMNYCANRSLSDCFFIGDMAPDDDEVGDAQDFVNDVSLKNSYGAVYMPWLLAIDPTGVSADPIPVPPSGYVVGMYAKTDANRGVWKAPAGIETALAGSSGLISNLTDAQHGDLNVDPYNVNVIRQFKNAGRVIWGARTISSDPEYRYVPVRRMAIMLRVSLYRGTQWVVFEPNDEPLWAQIRLNVGAFMHGLFRQGAFQGKSPKEAYLVKCDAETTTQNDINQGIVNIIIGFAPLKPAEFVMIKIQQLAGQVEA